jgi:hypothetical protein
LNPEWPIPIYSVERVQIGRLRGHHMKTSIMHQSTFHTSTNITIADLEILGVISRNRTRIGTKECSKHNNNRMWRVPRPTRHPPLLGAYGHLQLATFMFKANTIPTFRWRLTLIIYYIFHPNQLSKQNRIATATSQLHCFKMFVARYLSKSNSFTSKSICFSSGFFFCLLTHYRTQLTTWSHSSGSKFANIISIMGTFSMSLLCTSPSRSLLKSTLFIASECVFFCGYDCANC